MTDSAKADLQRTANGFDWKRAIRRIEPFGLIIVWLAMIAIFGYLRPATFLTWANFSTLLGSQAVLVVVTLGLLIPLTANDFDLSIAYMMTMSSMIIAVEAGRRSAARQPALHRRQTPAPRSQHYGGDESPVAATAQQNRCVTELPFLQRLDSSDRPGLENDDESDFSLRLPAVGTLLNLAGGCQGMH
jgi:ribose/xylose/arabinose/galactoside ABC-type transport system permease subunit